MQGSAYMHGIVQYNEISSLLDPLTVCMTEGWLK